MPEESSGSVVVSRLPWVIGVRWRWSLRGADLGLRAQNLSQDGQASVYLVWIDIAVGQAQVLTGWCLGKKGITHRNQEFGLTGLS